MALGKVYIVGIGPGDPAFLSRRCLQVLEKIDSYLYDETVSERILQFLNPEAEKVYIGIDNEGNKPTQEEVNRMLVRRAFDGKRVARLRNGDPYLLGRGSEEALFCLSQNVGFEVVSGVSAILAASVGAGIPLLQSGLSRSVLVTKGPFQEKSEGPPDQQSSGEERKSSGLVKKGGVQIKRRKKTPSIPKDQGVRLRQSQERQLLSRISPSESSNTGARDDSTGNIVDWVAISNAADTIVVLESWGKDQFRLIKEGLLKGNRTEDEPVALISRGGTHEQKTRITTLGKLEADFEQSSFPPPIVLIIGDVVNLSQFLNLEKQKMLLGLDISFICTDDISPHWRYTAEDAGATVQQYIIANNRLFPEIEEEILALNGRFNRTTLALVYSEVAVNLLRANLEAQSNLPLKEYFADSRIIAVGSATAHALEKAGLRPIVVQAMTKQDQLIDLIVSPGNIKEVIIFGGADSQSQVQQKLTEAGIKAEELLLYYPAANDSTLRELYTNLESGRIHLLFFDSPDSVKTLSDTWGNETLKKALHNKYTITANTITSVQLTNSGLKADITLGHPHPDQLLEALVQWKKSPSDPSLYQTISSEDVHKKLNEEDDDWEEEGSLQDEHEDDTNW